MCPVCLTSVALLALTATSTGGLAALITAKLRTGPMGNKTKSEIQVKGQKNETSRHRVSR